MQGHYDIVNDVKTREIVLAMLCGDINKIGEMLHANNNLPLPIDETDSYELAYALYDAFRFDDDNSRIFTQHVDEILQLHKTICPPQERHYIDRAYINDPMTPYYDKEELRVLKEDNIADIDIELMDKGLEFDEQAVIDLLKKGACPYYINRFDVYIDDDGKPQYEYCDIARLIDWLSEEVYFYWQEGDYDKIRDPKSESNKMLSSFIEDVINVAANHRMLYIIDSNITKEAREKGIQMMTQYLGQVFPIMDYEP